MNRPEANEIAGAMQELQDSLMRYEKYGRGNIGRASMISASDLREAFDKVARLMEQSLEAMRND